MATCCPLLKAFPGPSCPGLIEGVTIHIDGDAGYGVSGAILPRPH